MKNDETHENRQILIENRKYSFIANSENVLEYLTLCILDVLLVQNWVYTHKLQYQLYKNLTHVKPPSIVSTKLFSVNQVCFDQYLVKCHLELHIENIFYIIFYIKRFARIYSNATFIKRAYFLP